MDEKHLAIIATAIRVLVEHGATEEDVAPLVGTLMDITDELYAARRDGCSGKKPMSLSRLIALSGFAAAVTALKDGRAVDDVIAEVAIPNGIDRKDLKNFRDRINRGGVDKGMYTEYLTKFEKMPKDEIMACLSDLATAFVPNPR